MKKKNYFIDEYFSNKAKSHEDGKDSDVYPALSDQTPISTHVVSLYFTSPNSDFG